MHRVMCLALLALACGGCPDGGVLQSPAGTSTTLILVRHCERDPGLDPPLNAEGQARAAILTDVLRENGVTAIYATDLLRNRQSVAALAEELGLNVNLVNPALYADTVFAANQVLDEVLRDHAGGTVLFCGNIGSTLGTPGICEALYERLGGTGTAPVRYQDMYVCIIPENGATRFIKTIYGPRSSLD